ncbi:carnitine 3-dehydrogenase [Chachezhania sediminis]|uniref:carnitine 3-dehydrogenase n=1 Tax=Chachezhania sediminis TaxID=2599291 RepID=UPI00131CF2B7|nr:carnitine 3-dehydrogenase [Chachezhania sediminis]
MTRTAAIIGGGVIGGGWVARFLQAGWDVRIFDPDPEAGRKIGAVLDNARRAVPGLTSFPMPEEGRMTFHPTVAEAVEGAAWIQESVPERLALKQAVLEQVEAAAAADAIVGSSTSGFKPSELQAGRARPGQIVVTHPFNPVYLLPLVELVTTDANPGPVIEDAKAILSSLTMYPLHLKKEIDAHVADRLLEAVWREALWLVSDGIATTEEIDEAIRMGFGLRWAQMGLFETYRIAGGEAGMRHFLSQFGPALEWPWTKLMDVPEFNDDLVDRIAGQSDAQSGHHSIRELERIRDANLVSILRGLKHWNWGAGKLLADRDAQRKRETEPGRTVAELEDLSQPLLTVSRAVPLDWTDFNGHMTEPRYQEAFAAGTFSFMNKLGVDDDYIAGGKSFFTAESHLRHLGEVHAGDRIEIRTQMLLGEGRKLHLFHKMKVNGKTVATGEHFMLHVDLATRQPCATEGALAENLARMSAAHGPLPYPKGAGLAIRHPDRAP